MNKAILCTTAIYLSAVVMLQISAVASPAKVSKRQKVTAGAPSVWGTGYAWGRKSSPQPKSAVRLAPKLYENDDLLPGQNRTQALRYEAETGHLPFNEDGLVDKNPKPTKHQPTGKHKMIRYHRGAR